MQTDTPPPTQPDAVRCGGCQRLQRDRINPSEGIGDCEFWKQSTLAMPPYNLMPCYPGALRHCRKFTPTAATVQ